MTFPEALLQNFGSLWDNSISIVLFGFPCLLLVILLCSAPYLIRLHKNKRLTETGTPQRCLIKDSRLELDYNGVSYLVLRATVDTSDGPRDFRITLESPDAGIDKKTKNLEVQLFCDENQRPTVLKTSKGIALIRLAYQPTALPEH